MVPGLKLNFLMMAITPTLASSRANLIPIQARGPWPKLWKTYLQHQNIKVTLPVESRPDRLVQSRSEMRFEKYMADASSVIRVPIHRKILLIDAMKTK